jgi:hypothetical protein
MTKKKSPKSKSKKVSLTEAIWIAQRGQCAVCRTKLKLAEAVRDKTIPKSEPPALIHPKCLNAINLLGDWQWLQKVKEYLGVTKLD